VHRGSGRRAIAFSITRLPTVRLRVSTVSLRVKISWAIFNMYEYKGIFRIVVKQALLKILIDRNH